MKQQVRHSQQARRHGRPFCQITRTIIKDASGVSAVEFALFAPMLVFSLLAMVDLGFAISERMAIGHILRAGAQEATEHGGPADIDRVLRATATGVMPLATPGATGDATSLALQVRLLCTCATAPELEVVCTTTCPADQPTQIFYALSASKTYSGLLLPRIAQSRSLQVQVR